jgi:hypothetical protein
MRAFLILIFLGTGGLFTSCSSTLDFHVPTQSFSSPEVVGETLGVTAQAAFSNSTKFRLARLEQAAIFSSQVDISTEEGTTKDNILNTSAALGLGNAVEATYRAYADSPNLIGAKVQLIGRDEGQKLEGIKLSLHAGYGSGQVDNKSLSASNGSGTTREYNSTLDIEAYELGSSLGYRLSETFMPYLSYNFLSYDAEGNLSSASFTDQTITGRAKVRSTQLGLLINKSRFYLQLEGGHAKSTWRGADSRDDYTLGLSLGMRIFTAS